MKENKNPSVVKVVIDWKGNQRGVKSLSSDPLKTQLVEAQSNLTEFHIWIYLYSRPYFGEKTEPLENLFQTTLFHDEFNSIMNLIAVCVLAL